MIFVQIHVLFVNPLVLLHPLKGRINGSYGISLCFHPICGILTNVSGYLIILFPHGKLILAASFPVSQ